MKKKILLGLCIGVTVLGLTACTEKKNEEEKEIGITNPFTITCEGYDDSIEGVKATNKSVYNFGKDQYVTDYEVTTISVYSDKKTYKTYKKSAEETAKSSENDLMVYTVTTDDKTKTVNFSYKVTVNKEMLDEAEDKDFYKAVKVLERAKANPNATCTIEGAEESQLK